MTPLSEVLPPAFGRWRGFAEVQAALAEAVARGARPLSVATSRQGFSVLPAWLSITLPPPRRRSVRACSS